MPDRAVSLNLCLILHKTFQAMKKVLFSLGIMILATGTLMAQDKTKTAKKKQAAAAAIMARLDIHMLRLVPRLLP
jgi:hypothetical protein